MFVHKVAEASRNLQKKRTPCWDTDMPKEESFLFTKAVEAARDYSVGRAGLCSNNTWATKADRSADNRILLGPLSELSTQCLYKVLANWSQKKCRAKAATGSAAGCGNYLTGDTAAGSCR